MIVDLNKDASKSGIDEYIDRMGLNRIDSFITKVNFRYLLKNAYTRSAFLDLVVKSNFGRCEIQENSISLEISLQKRWFPATLGRCPGKATTLILSQKELRFSKIQQSRAKARLCMAPYLLACFVLLQLTYVFNNTKLNKASPLTGPSLRSKKGSSSPQSRWSRILIERFLTNRTLASWANYVFIGVISFWCSEG